jgi:hypothetical protein
VTDQHTVTIIPTDVPPQWTWSITGIPQPWSSRGAAWTRWGARRAARRALRRYLRGPKTYTIRVGREGR